MRLKPIALLLLALAPCLRADPLTQADRDALLEKLQKIQDSADAKVDERYRVAVAAFRAGMANDAAAKELFMKCTEKVQFEDQHRKAQDFREWKRKEEERHGDPGFARALRHQLRWLVLTLQVASSKQPATSFGPDAMRIVEDIYADADTLNGQQGVLQQGATGSVFAKAYEIGNVNVKEWPQSPLDLNGVFGKVILPPLRSPARIEALRTAWMKRIQLEGIGKEKWTRNGGGGPGEKEDTRIGTKESLRSPEYEKFLQDTYPDLLWQMEEDVYKSGDQRGAALRMFQHLEKYVTHPKAPEWGKRFKDLLETKKEGDAAPGGAFGAPAPAPAAPTAPPAPPAVAPDA